MRHCRTKLGHYRTNLGHYRTKLGHYRTKLGPTVLSWDTSVLSWDTTELICYDKKLQNKIGTVAQLLPEETLTTNEFSLFFNNNKLL